MSTFLVTYIRKNPFELPEVHTPIHPYTKVHTPSHWLDDVTDVIDVNDVIQRAFKRFKPCVSMINMNKVIAKTVSSQSKSSYLFILVFMVTLHLKLLLVKILDLISFHMLQTRSLYHYFSWSYSQNRFNQSKFSILFILVSMVTLNQILFLTKILDFISFHMLQTRSLYHYFSWSYSQNRLNQSKCSISDSMVTMVTIIIYACYAVQRFKLEVSTLNMNENIAIWKMSRDLVNHFGLFPICKTILYNQKPKMACKYLFSSKSS